MRVSLRIALGYFLIVALAAYLVFNTFVAEVKPGVKQAMEETMVDAANVLAELAADDLGTGALTTGRFAAAVAAYRGRDPDARIYSLSKRSSDLRVHVTDARGIVVFDSHGEDLGRDFSQWRDVFRTLRGEYGARATRLDPTDDSSLVLHVAAPVLGRAPPGGGPRPLIGVLTVAKPTRTVLPFAERAEQRVTNAGLLLLGAALLIGGFFTVWLTHSIRTLRDFARDVAADRRPSPPRLGRNELGDLEAAIHRMREKLDGRDYVDRYVQSLTHELKSPIAGIRAAAEVLSDPRATTDEQHRFLGHIGEQTGRLSAIVDRMLELANVESRRHLADTESVDLRAAILHEISSLEPRAAAAGVRFDVTVEDDASVTGDAFLLGRALANLLENALAFAPAGSAIEVKSRRTDAGVAVSIRDHGSGLPDYATDRVCERFYSLPRPDGTRGTGLGLPFVQEIARLHGGRLQISNHRDGGCEAALILAART
ncbi:MAG: two-component system sensor histidine kinase CreC [Burkholderiales bacterium]